MNQTVGRTPASHVVDIKYVDKCLLVRYSFTFDDASLGQEGKVLEIASGVNEKVKEVLEGELGNEVRNIEPHTVYSKLISIKNRQS